MTISDYINIALAIISVVLFGVSLFTGGKNKAVSSIAGLIYEAENKYGAGTGTTKMSWVVGRLYAMLPAVVRPLLPQSMLQTVAQSIFDQVQAFGLLKIKQLADKTGTAAK
jgi:hypothetical protein